MKISPSLTVGLLLIAATMTRVTAFAAVTGDLLQQGLYAEEVEGNIDSAIKYYDQIIRDGAAPRNHVAQALYREGLCYLKLKNYAAARIALEKLITEHPDQTDLLAKARPVLDELSDVDPATLMPPGTLVYIEFGSPGKQIDTALNLVKGTPFENPLAAIAGTSSNSDWKTSSDMVTALLNPSMLAEFKKIRSSAIGVTGISGNQPAMISVLYPGKSDAMRGLLLAALGMAGKPGEPIEGMQQVRLPEDMAVAYDDRIVICARPASQLTWVVKQYKGRTPEPSLATEKSFAKMKQMRSDENALTVWANVDAAYAQAQKMIPPEQWPAQLAAVNGMLDFPNIDELILTQSFETNGFNLNARVGLKEGNHCLAYQFVRTARISRTALEAVPSEAIALASFTLAQPDPVQAAFLRPLIQTATKVDLSDELFTNIEQITLFLMPAGPDIATNVALPFYIGVAIDSHDPALTRQSLITLASTQTGTKIDPNASRFRVGNNGTNALYCHLDQSGSTTVLSLNRGIVDASLAALKNHKSVGVAGPLHRAVNELSPDASKAILVNVGGAMRLMAAQAMPRNFNEQQAAEWRASVAQLARAADATFISCRTIEQTNCLEASASLAGIPSVATIIGPVSQIARLNNEAKAAEQARQVELDKPAIIARASQPPAMDGKSDDGWSAARAYKLGNTMYTPPASPADLSADYRTLWDAENLYVRVDVTDNVLKHDSAADRWYESDGVEVYIDADDAKASSYGQNDYQYTFIWDPTSPMLQEAKHNRTAGVQYALVTTDKGYRLDVKFPWETLGVKPSAGAKVGLDVHVNDSDVAGKRKSKIAWHDRDDLAYDSPRQFGNAELAGLVGWWKFDEAEGTSAADSSGGHHTGTLKGHAKWAHGRIGGAIDLDGAGSYVRIADKAAFNFGGEATVAAWVKFRSVPAEWSAVIAKGDSAWRLSTVGQEKQFHFAVGEFTATGDAAKVNSSQAIADGQWHQVAGVYDGRKLSLYVDGKLDQSSPWTGGVGRNDFEVLIGENAEKKNRCFDGLIDDVRVYNYALPESEIKALAAGK